VQNHPKICTGPSTDLCRTILRSVQALHRSVQNHAPQKCQTGGGPIINFLVFALGSIGGWAWPALPLHIAPPSRPWGAVGGGDGGWLPEGRGWGGGRSCDVNLIWMQKPPRGWSGGRRDWRRPPPPSPTMHPRSGGGWRLLGRFFHRTACKQRGRGGESIKNGLYCTLPYHTAHTVLSELCCACYIYRSCDRREADEYLTALHLLYCSVCTWSGVIQCTVALGYNLCCTGQYDMCCTASTVCYVMTGWLY
jgi:hypothetical protein